MQQFLRTLAIVAAMMLPFASQAQTLTVCDGTVNSQTVPFDGYNADAAQHNQMIYPATDLTAMSGQAITQMVFYIDQNASNGTYTTATRLGTWTVSLGETTATTLSDLDATTSLTQVYQGNFDCSTGTLTITFDDAYLYNGGNLLVDLNHAAASWNRWYFLGVSTASTVSYNSYDDDAYSFLPKCTFTYAAAPTCFKVTNLAIDASQTTASSLTLTWTDALNSGASYDVYTVTPTDTTFVGNSTTTSYTFNGLNANTVYSFVVMTNCGGGDLTEYTAPVSGRTACAATTPLPFSENFGGYTGLPSLPYYGPSVIPACWDYYSNGTNTAETSGYSSYFGGVGQYTSIYSYACIEANNPYLCMPIQITGSAVTSQTSLDYQTARGNTKYAILPAFAESLSSLQISFDYKMYSSYSATGNATTLELGYVTGDTSTFVPMQQYQAVSSLQHVVELNLSTLAAAAPAGARLAFKYSGVHNGTSTYDYTTNYCGIDNILVEELPSCMRVSDLTVAAVTSSTVTLNWVDATNSGATYSVYVITPTDTLNIESGIVDTAYTVEDLDPNTQYVFAVEANCSASDASDMTVVSGRTACAAETMPWSENFDNWTEKSPCWSFLSGLLSAGNPVANSLAWTLNSSYGNHITVSGKALTMNLYNENRYWAVTPAVAITSDDAVLSVDVAVAAWGAATPNYDDNDTLAFLATTDGGATWTVLQSYGGTQLNALGNAYTTLVVPIPSDYYGQDVRFAIYGGSVSGTSPYDNRIVFDNVSVDEAPSCLPVAGLTVSAITATGATLTWVGDADGYTIYDMSDSSVYEYTVDTTVDLYALDANTQYSFGVAANCGSDESDTVIVSFRTSCAAYTLPFSENFTNSLESDPCWAGATGTTADEAIAGTALSLTANTQWTYSSSVSDGLEAGHYRVNIYGTSCKKWMITPEIDLSTASNALLTFDAAFTGYNSSNPASGFESNTTQKFMVLASTNGGQTWALVSDIPLTTLASSTYLTQYVNLNAYAGENVRLAFYAQSTTSGGDNDLHIDNISITESTGEICYPVSNLTVSDITTDGATLSWTGDASSYNVYVLGATDTTFAENVSDTTVTLTGLTAMTQYTYGIRSACGNSESIIMTITFNTACNAVSLPYTETFASTSASRNCWNLVSNNTTNVGGSNGMGFVTAGGREVLRFSSYSYASDYNQYGFSPLMNVSDDATNLQVKVVYGTYGSSDQLYFGYVTATDTVWDPTAYTTSGSYSANDWQSQTFIVPATATQLAVRYYGNCSYYGWIDSVEVTEMTGDYCAPVAALTVDSADASSISLSWSSDGTSFSVVNMADGSVVATATEPHATVSGLTASTAYTFGVVNNCPTVSSDTVTISAATQCVNMCTLTIYAVDGYGDGWTDSYIDFVQNGASVAQFSMADQYEEDEEIYETATVSVCSGSTLSLNWVSNSSWDSEASFTIVNASNDTLYSTASAANLASPFYTVADPCANDIVIVPDSMQVTIAVNDATMGTTIPAPGVHYFYEGDSASVVAVPNTGYHLSGWTFSLMYNSQSIYVDTTINVPVDNFFDLFSGWVVEAGDNAYVFSVTANFTSEPINDSVVLTVAVNDATMGTTTPAPGTYSYHNGDALSLVATPNAGYALSAWQFSLVIDGDSLYTDEYVDNTFFEDEVPANFFEIFQNITAVTPSLYGAVFDVTAIFSADTAVNNSDSVIIITAVNDATMGTVSPAPGTHVYYEGDVFSITATPNAGYHLEAWVTSVSYMGQVISTNDTLPGIPGIFDSLSADDLLGMTYNITAIFAAGQQVDSLIVTTSVNNAEWGTITPAPGTHYYTVGDEVTFDVQPNDGYYLYSLQVSMSAFGMTFDTVFTSYEDFVTEMDSALVVDESMLGATITLHANFQPTGVTPEEYTVTVNYNATMGNVLVNGQAAGNGSSITVTEGSSVSFTANAYNNYEFVAWVDNGDTVGRETIYTINAIDAAHSVTAVFREKVGIADVELDNVDIYSVDSRIYVRGAEGKQVYLFDVNGRLMSREANAAESVEFRVSNSGVYLVKVGNAAAKRVVVIR